MNDRYEQKKKDKELGMRRYPHVNGNNIGNEKKKKERRKVGRQIGIISNTNDK